MFLCRYELLLPFYHLEAVWPFSSDFIKVFFFPRELPLIGSIFCLFVFVFQTILCKAYICAGSHLNHFSPSF